MAQRMAKFALAAIAALVLGADAARMPQAEIVITPTPPVAGQTMRIEYTGKLPATIDLDWYPSGDPKQVTIPEKPGYIEIKVPDASSVIASDSAGEAEPVATTITRP